jgi:RNA-directed DNA polymerase
MGFSEDSIELCLSYAESLNINGVPIIYNLTHLSKLTAIKRNYIIQAAVSSKHSQAYYRMFVVNKKNGGKRIIHEPLPNLKKIQYWILQNILSNINISSYTKAYIQKRGLKQNIRFHRKQKKVLNLDIKDFFPSISHDQVETVFKAVGYSHTVSKYLTKLCLLGDSLPQGAPTSPFISNIIMKPFDDEVSEFARSQNINYTRYADDMTFSGDFDESIMIGYINGILSKYGFELNDRKTNLMYNSQRQIVTGIVVNDKIQLSKDKRKNLRLVLHYLKLNGFDGFLLKNKIAISKEKFINSVMGQISFGLYLNKEDKTLLELKKILLEEKKKLWH